MEPKRRVIKRLLKISRTKKINKNAYEMTCRTISMINYIWESTPASVTLASDVGGNPLRRPALSHQKLLRSCCRRTTLTSSSVVESTSLPCLLSMNGENTSDSFPSFNFSLLTGLLPCGAVCTGPEGAIETTSVFLVGEDCLSTSLVTISLLSDFVMQALSTHSILVLNSLSTEDLSCLILFAIVVHELSPRGYLERREMEKVEVERWVKNKLGLRQYISNTTCLLTGTYVNAMLTSELNIHKATDNQRHVNVTLII
ncbi:hypothetical protein YC2023_119290 [Brassica napus]